MKIIKNIGENNTISKIDYGKPPGLSSPPTKKVENTVKQQSSPQIKSLFDSIINGNPKKNLKDSNQSSPPQKVQSQTFSPEYVNNILKTNPQFKSMNDKFNSKNNDNDTDSEVSNNDWLKKYYSQTAGMEQKYLKYKNKYLSLKQKLGV
jgi:hypothetical protein